MPREKSGKFHNEYMFEQKYKIDEIRMDLIGYCYFESLVSFHARNKYTIIIPRSIIALIDYRIFNIYVCLAQSD